MYATAITCSSDAPRLAHLYAGADHDHDANHDAGADHNNADTGCRSIHFCSFFREEGT